jgi:HEAT repeat protein
MRRITLALLLAMTAACFHGDEPMAGGKPLSHWKKEATKVSLFSFWNSSKDERRHEAFRRLSEIGEPAVPALVDLLKKNKVPVSGDAFNALGNLGTRAAGAVPDMIELLHNENATLRTRAAWILGTIGPDAESSVPSLAPLLKDPNVKVRQAAAQALGQIGGDGVATLERARVSDNATLREASMRGMARSEMTPDERRTYIAGALGDPEPQVRLRALDLLMTAKADEAEALAQYLVKALNDADGEVKKAAHTVLNVYLQHNGATPALLAVVLEGGDAESRADAAWHLGNPSRTPFGPGYSPNDAPVIDALVRALDADDAKVRIYAGRALAQGEGSARERGLQALRRELPNAEPILAVRAARILWMASRDVATVTPVYERGLQDPEKWNRVETMSAILELGQAADAFQPHFERLRNDPDPEVRERAEKALYWLKVRR